MGITLNHKSIIDELSDRLSEGTDDRITDQVLADIGDMPDVMIHDALFDAADDHFWSAVDNLIDDAVTLLLNHLRESA